MGLTLLDLPGETPSVGVPRDGRDRPLIVPRGGGKPKAHTRMSSFSDCLEDKTALGNYGSRNAMIGATLDESVQRAVRGVVMYDAEGNVLEAPRTIDDLDAAEKRKLDGVVQKAQIIAGADRKSAKGTQLHELSEIVDAGKELPANIDEKDLADMAAYRLETIDFQVVAVEQFVVVEEIGAAGTFDRVMRYDGLTPDNKVPQLNHFIFDIKTGKVEYGGLKMSCQLAGYSRGWLYDWTKFPVDVKDPKAFEAWKKTVFSEEEAAAAYTKLEGVNQEWGVIIHLPAGKGEAKLYWADLTLGWEAAHEAVAIRALRSRNGKALLPFAV